MKILIVLFVCYIVSHFQFDSTVKQQEALFLDKVADASFGGKNKYIKFKHGGGILLINDKEISKNLRIHSVYTSSKAVYKASDAYLGIVLIDSSIYITSWEDNVMDINFEELHFFARKEFNLLGRDGFLKNFNSIINLNDRIPL